MTVYNIGDGKEKPPEEPVVVSAPVEEKIDQKWFSSLVARTFFFFLLLVDLSWLAYAVMRLFLWSAITCVTLGRINLCLHKTDHALVSIKRALICAVSLFIAVFSPSFGIMIACTYFIMYDPAGIEEVVPASLRTQFKEFFPH